MFTIGSAEFAQANNDAQEVVQEDTIDAAVFFHTLVQRYRKLIHYVEETQVEEVVQDLAVDSPPIRTRTQVRVEIVNGQLNVDRPGVVDDAVQALVPQSGSATEEDLWLLPHMNLRFAEDPLHEFRRGIEEGFVPEEANIVSVDDRQLIRLELRSNTGEEEPAKATFELFVDPKRMLVERIEGEQLLPGGLSYRTRLEIEPVHAYGGEPSTTFEENGEVDSDSTDSTERVPSG